MQSRRDQSVKDLSKGGNDGHDRHSVQLKLPNDCNPTFEDPRSCATIQNSIGILLVDLQARKAMPWRQMGVSKIRSTLFGGVLIMRILLFRVLL